MPDELNTTQRPGPWLGVERRAALEETASEAEEMTYTTEREATCQQGMPCGDPGSCPDPVGCGFVEVAAETPRERSHYHCPYLCEHPQPFTVGELLLCGSCFFGRDAITPMVPCSPEICE